MSNKEQVNVIVDANEASQKPRLLEILVMHEDVEDYQVKPLDEGDFIIGDCIFERKTPSDFASSLQEGRLRDQVERMAATDMSPFILVEGDMEDFEHLTGTDIQAKSLRGMDASIEMRNNIPVKYCSHIENTADMGVRLARKQKEDVGSIQARQTEALRDVSFIEKVFLAIEGVGVKTAENLSRDFDSLEKALSADQSDFERVEGVGVETSEKIYEKLHSSTNINTSDYNNDRTVIKI